jgi:hypothetical protein
MPDFDDLVDSVVDFFTKESPETEELDYSTEDDLDADAIKADGVQVKKDFENAHDGIPTIVMVGIETICDLDGSGTPVNCVSSSGPQ